MRRAGRAGLAPLDPAARPLSAPATARRVGVVASSLVLAVLAAASHASAQPPPAETFAAARAAERAHRPAEAARLYEDVARAAPNARLASRARERLAYLRARSEGDYAPLARMLAFRDTPAADLAPPA